MVETCGWQTAVQAGCRFLKPRALLLRLYRHVAEILVGSSSDDSYMLWPLTAVLHHARTNNDHTRGFNVQLIIVDMFVSVALTIVCMQCRSLRRHLDWKLTQHICEWSTTAWIHTQKHMLLTRTSTFLLSVTSSSPPGFSVWSSSSPSFICLWTLLVFHWWLQWKSTCLQ